MYALLDGNNITTLIFHHEVYPFFLSLSLMNLDIVILEYVHNVPSYIVVFF